MNCYCCSNILYTDCCKPHLDGIRYPKTAEALMRSRYSAYCTLNNAYLNDTVHGAALATISEAIQAHNWVNLSIISSHQGTESDTTGMVEFKASFEDNGALYTMHEISKFEKISGRWYYTEGVINES